MEKEKMSKNFKILILVLFILFVIITIIGFVVFSKNREKVVTEDKKGGNVTLNYSSDVNFLNITNAVPVTDAVAVTSNTDGSYFDFSVDTEIKDAKDVVYELSVKKVSGNVNLNDIKIYLEKEDSGTYNSIMEPTIFKEEKKKTDIGTEKGNMILVKQKNTKSTIDNYRIRTWVSETSLVTGANYKLEINIVAKAE
jgi:hypothetical protein